MNIWIKKSTKLANSRGYLDRLSTIYKIPDKLTKREISDENLKTIRKEIRKARKTKKFPALIKTLFEIERFPIDDPYIGYLRADERAIYNNPKTVNRIGKRLLKMDYNEMIKECKKPKSPSRQIGKMFRAHVKSLGYPVLPKEDFETYSGTALLDGSDKVLMNYANKKLGCGLRKGVDIVVKVGKRHIIGEAKFITTWGGSQENQFRSAMDLIKRKKGAAIQIAVIDGVPWIKDTSWHEEICESKGTVLSALLLKEFIESMKTARQI